MSGRKDRQPISYPTRFVATEGDRRALIVLLHLTGLTPRRLGELAMAHRSAERLLGAVRRGAVGGPATAEKARSVDPDQVLARLRDCGARLVAVSDPEYPSSLRHLFDPPAGLFVRGRALGRLLPRVAIVGARKASPGGREAARDIAAGLARAGACVVSGGARGIDEAGHAGALASGGTSVAVLGSGIDVLYPRENRYLFPRIEASGALVSEYPPGTPAEPFRFPARNRIVAALSVAVVIVEGALGSGSMITAEHALDVGREVFAVPGAISSALAAVPLKLIREGAAMIRGPRDLLEDLGWSVPDDAKDAPLPLPPPGLTPEEARVWEALGAAMTPDQVSSSTDLSLPGILAALARLEIGGFVREVGGRYERTAPAGSP